MVSKHTLLASLLSLSSPSASASHFCLSLKCLYILLLLVVEVLDRLLLPQQAQALLTFFSPRLTTNQQHPLSEVSMGACQLDGEVGIYIDCIYASVCTHQPFTLAGRHFGIEGVEDGGGGGDVDDRRPALHLADCPWALDEGGTMYVSVYRIPCFA